MLIEKRESLKNRLLMAVDQYRSMIIDPVEFELGDSHAWKPLRSRLLKALGDRGLSGKICEIVNSEFSDQTQRGPNE